MTQPAISSLVDGDDKDTITDDIDNDNKSMITTPIINTDLQQMDNSLNDDEIVEVINMNIRNVSVDTITKPQYSKSNQSTPHFTPQQSLNQQQFTSSVIEEEIKDSDDDKEEEEELDDLKRTCKAIGQWYFMMNNDNNYYDDKGNGKFTKWFNETAHEIDSMNEEFDDHYLGCSYLEFDIDNKTKINLFPLSEDIKQHYHRQQIQFQIMLHCFKTGKAPNIHSLTANKIYLKSYEDDTINYDNPNEKLMQETEEFFNSLCPKLSKILFKQKDLKKMLSIGYKNNVNLLELLVDIYMRDRIEYLLSSKEITNPSPFLISDWVEKNRYIKHVIKKHNIGAMIKSSIESYGKRVMPKIETIFIRQIIDNLPNIFKYFKAATQFIHKLLKDGSKHHKYGGYPISNAPFQFDFCIAVAECTHELQLDIFPTMQGISDPDLIDEMEQHHKKQQEDRKKENPYFDLLGDIDIKLKQNGYKYIKEEFDPDKYMKIDHKSMSFVRCFMEIYNKFIQQYNIKKDQFPKGSRLCALIDRRKTITKIKDLEGVNTLSNNQYFQFDRNKNGNKKDDLYLWIPKIYNKIDNKSGFNEIYHESIAEELIPKMNETTTTTSFYSDTNNNFKYNQLRESITSKTHNLNGGLLIFSFQINAEDEIACYLWHQGKCTRFLPHDVISLLPKMFVSTEENLAFIQHSIPKKSSKHYHDVVADIKYNDRYFDQWYQKISNKFH